MNKKYILILITLSSITHLHADLMGDITQRLSSGNTGERYEYIEEELPGQLIQLGRQDRTCRALLTLEELEDLQSEGTPLLSADYGQHLFTATQELIDGSERLTKSQTALIEQLRRASVDVINRKYPGHAFTTATLTTLQTAFVKPAKRRTEVAYQQLHDVNEFLRDMPQVVRGKKEADGGVPEAYHGLLDEAVREAENTTLKRVGYATVTTVVTAATIRYVQRLRTILRTSETVEDVIEAVEGAAETVEGVIDAAEEGRFGLELAALTGAFGSAKSVLKPAAIGAAFIAVIYYLDRLLHAPCRQKQDQVELRYNKQLEKFTKKTTTTIERLQETCSREHRELRGEIGHQAEGARSNAVHAMGIATKLDQDVRRNLDQLREFQTRLGIELATHTAGASAEIKQQLGAFLVTVNGLVASISERDGQLRALTLQVAALCQRAGVRIEHKGFLARLGRGRKSEPALLAAGTRVAPGVVVAPDGQPVATGGGSAEQKGDD